MVEKGSIQNGLEDVKVNVKLKLAALWTATLFVWVYVDIITFYKPGFIEDILAGKVWQFDISQTWALGALALMTVPVVMIFLSLALPARVNRMVTMFVAGIYVLVSIGNSVGETWAYIWLGSATEVVLLSLIIWHAWKWPTTAGAR
ncbi:MAG: hypothetical protein FJ314_02120 [SAR202 cluster bacterium]|nr:hypothetical protein [SAR202 cluster bacterium]